MLFTRNEAFILDGGGLHQYGIMTIVDSVSGMFKEPIHVDDGQIDIICGGYQKALSAPPGLLAKSGSHEVNSDLHEK